MDKTSSKIRTYYPELKNTKLIEDWEDIVCKKADYSKYEIFLIAFDQGALISIIGQGILEASDWVHRGRDIAIRAVFIKTVIRIFGFRKPENSKLRLKLRKENM